MGFFFGKDIFSVPVNGKSRMKTLAHGRDLMICSLSFDEGGMGPSHSHRNTQITAVLSGRFEFTLDGDTAVLAAGDSVYVAPNAEHSLICLEKGEILDIYAPQMEEYE